MWCAEEAKKVCCSSGYERTHKDLKDVLQVVSEVVEAKSRSVACRHCVHGVFCRKKRGLRLRAEHVKFDSLLATKFSCVN